MFVASLYMFKFWQMENPRGGTLKCSFIRRLGPFYWGSKFWISIFFGVFRKINIFWGMKILWIFFGGHHKIGLYLGVISMYFRVFSWGKGTEWGYFLGLLKFQIFFGGAWNSRYFFGVNGRFWVRAYVCRKHQKTPPPLGENLCDDRWSNV